LAAIEICRLSVTVSSSAELRIDDALLFTACVRPGMEQNVGDADKAVRIGAGALAGLVSLGILLGALSLPAVLSPVLGVAAVVLLVTGFTGVCGLYAMLGTNTCPAR
jgi:hypothetical protein